MVARVTKKYLNLPFYGYPYFQEGIENYLMRLEETVLMVLETFLVNQLSFGHELHYPESGDFLVDRKYTIEAGEKNKTGEQLKGVEEAYIAAEGC